MTYNPKPEYGSKSYPAPPVADYSDEISAEQWEAIVAATEQYQELEGQVISGEPW